MYTNQVLYIASEIKHNNTLKTFRLDIVCLCMEETKSMPISYIFQMYSDYTCTSSSKEAYSKMGYTLCTSVFLQMASHKKVWQ